MVQGECRVEDLPSSILRQLYQYWLDKKGDLLMPSRSSLNPCEIKSLLPNIILIDVEHNPRRYRSRLVGTETVKAMDIDVTGKYLDEFPNISSDMKPRYDWLVTEKRPYFYEDNMKYSNKPYINFHGVALPLSANGNDVDILMIGVHYEYAKAGKNSGQYNNKSQLAIIPLRA